MYYVIVDSEGNRLGASQDEQEIIDELRALAEEDGEDADHLLLLTYGDDGRLGGPTRTLEDLAANEEAEADPPLSIIFEHEPARAAVYIDLDVFTARGFTAFAAATGVAEPQPVSTGPTVPDVVRRRVPA